VWVVSGSYWSGVVGWVIVLALRWEASDIWEVLGLVAVLRWFWNQCFNILFL